jgi:hypothetical protein
MGEIKIAHKIWREKLCNPLEDEVSCKVTLWEISEKKENIKMEGNNRYMFVRTIRNT